MPERENFGRELEPREPFVARSEASTAMNSAVMLPENGSSLWPATATATTRTEYSAGTALPRHSAARRLSRLIA
jgi:hypothetical protein